MLKGFGGTARSNLAECSRLQKLHLQTKCAVLPFPPETVCSSCICAVCIGQGLYDGALRLLGYFWNRRGDEVDTDVLIQGDEFWMNLVAAIAFHLAQHKHDQ